jgi:hypothetical protein
MHSLFYERHHRRSRQKRRKEKKREKEKNRNSFYGIEFEQKQEL